MLTTAIGHRAEEIQMQGLAPGDEPDKICDYVKNLKPISRPILLILVGHMPVLAEIGATFRTEGEVREEDFPFAGGMRLLRADKNIDEWRTVPCTFDGAQDHDEAIGVEHDLD